MPEKTIAQSLDDRGVLTLTLSRPSVCNALDDRLISEMTEAVVKNNRNRDVRVMVITGEGDSFCAGTDISWMEHLAHQQPADDARRLANLLLQVRNCSKPMVAKINGPAIGAGVALAIACDVSVAAEESVYALPAIRLGAVPAVIGPFLTEAMGVHQARRYLLTGETFSAMEARRLGVVHAVCLKAQLEETVEGLVKLLLHGGPEAIKETKALLNEFGTEPPSPSLLNEASKISARMRRDPEAREGLAAFIEKRRPNWMKF